MNHRVLVIGGSSYVGSSLCNRIANHSNLYYTYNKSVIEIDKAEGFIVDLNLENPFSNLEKEKPFDCVIWCAQSNTYSQNISDYKSLLDINVIGVYKTLEFCRKNKTKKIIYLSTGSVYENSKDQLSEESNINFKSHYGFTKYAAEKIFQHYSDILDLNTIVLRLFAVYGECQKNKVISKIRSQILKNEKIELNQGVGMYFTPIYIKDLLDILEKFIFQIDVDDYDIFNIACSESTSLLEIAKTISKIENKELTIVKNQAPITYSIANNSKLIKKLDELIQFTSIFDGLNNISRVDIN